MREVHGKVRVAMIGAGVAANRFHYPSLASFSDVEIAAICDLDPARLHSTADKYNVPGRYTDYRQMVEEVAPDAVYAIGQPHLMYDIWVWCLTQGLNLYIEKPMGLTLHQARTLAYLAEKMGCITQVSFQWRCSPLAVRLREAVLAHGALVHASCTFMKHAPGPYLGPTGQVIQNSVHAIDTLRWLCGAEVVKVHSVIRRVQAPDIDFVAAIICFDNGTVGTMLTNFTSGRRLFGIEIHGPGISAVADLEDKGYLYRHDRPGAEVHDAREVAGSDQFYVYAGCRAKNREFIDCVRAGRQPGSSFADAVKTMEVAETIQAKALLEGA